MWVAPAVVAAAASDKVVSPKFPIAQVWTQELNADVAFPPVADEARAYVALHSGQVTAWDLTDGHQLWHIDKVITAPLAAAGGLLFVAGGDAIEALRGTDHASVWTIPRIITTAPLVAVEDWLVAVTDTDVLAISSKDGRIIWRTPVGGVKLAPAVDEDMVYVGTDDGSVVALKLATGDKAWDALVEGGVTAIAAHHGIVYAGGGDKYFHTFRGGKNAHPPSRVGATVLGHIAFDDEHFYFAAKDNVIRALDLGNGNQRWAAFVRNRPFDGVFAGGHIVFAPLNASHDLPMFFAGNGKPSGTLALPGDAVLNLSPDIQESAAGVRLLVVTGGLNNQWQLTLFATTTEPALVPVADFLPDAGVDLLTDPALQPIGMVLGDVVLGDPPLMPLDAIGFPIVLEDPPLEPLTTLPGLQLRSLSPQLPARREGS
jgi:outer membrane protein assembly factor BamB